MYVISMHHIDKDLQKNKLLKHALKKDSACTVMHVDAIYILFIIGMSCPSWQWHRTGSCWSPVRTLPVVPLCCDLGFFLNSSGNKAVVNLHPIILLHTYTHTYTCNVQYTKLAQYMYFLYANTCILQSMRSEQQTKAHLYASMNQCNTCVVPAIVYVFSEQPTLLNGAGVTRLACLAKCVYVESLEDTVV